MNVGAGIAIAGIFIGGSIIAVNASHSMMPATVALCALTSLMIAAFQS